MVVDIPKLLSGLTDNSLTVCKVVLTQCDLCTRNHFIPFPRIPAIAMTADTGLGNTLSEALSYIQVTVHQSLAVCIFQRLSPPLFVLPKPL